MEILKIYLNEQLSIKHYVIEQLILLKILDMMDVKKIYLQCFFDKKTMGGPVNNEIERNKESTEE